MAKLRNVAVVGFAQAPIVVRDEHRIASEILYPQVRRALAECGVERDAIERLADDRIEHLRGHAVLVARHHGKLREAHDGDVAKLHRR